MHPLMQDLSGKTEEQLYDMLTDVGTKMHAVRMNGMNPAILDQLEMVRDHLEYALNEKRFEKDMNQDTSQDFITGEVWNSDEGNVAKNKKTDSEW